MSPSFTEEEAKLLVACGYGIFTNSAYKRHHPTIFKERDDQAGGMFPYYTLRREDGGLVIDRFNNLQKLLDNEC